MTRLGNGLRDAQHHDEALSVREADLAMMRRLGASEDDMLAVQGNLAGTYRSLGRLEDCLRTQRDVYSGRLRFNGEEDEDTLRAANNYADSLISLKRFKEAKALLRRTVPVARQVIGENHEDTLRLRLIYAEMLCKDPDATLDELREAVTTIEELARIARRVFGGPHPITVEIESSLRASRVVLSARDSGRKIDVESIREAVEAMAPGDA